MAVARRSRSFVIFRRVSVVYGTARDIFRLRIFTRQRFFTGFNKARIQIRIFVSRLTQSRCRGEIFNEFRRLARLPDSAPLHGELQNSLLFFYIPLLVTDEMLKYLVAKYLGQSILSANSSYLERVISRYYIQRTYTCI